MFMFDVCIFNLPFLYFAVHVKVIFFSKRGGWSLDSNTHFFRFFSYLQYLCGKELYVPVQVLQQQRLVLIFRCYLISNFKNLFAMSFTKIELTFWPVFFLSKTWRILLEIYCTRTVSRCKLSHNFHVTFST